MSPYSRPRSRQGRLPLPTLPSRRSTAVPPSEDELKLRHVQNELSGLRELVVEEHRGVHDHRHGLLHSCTAPPLFPLPRRPGHPSPLAHSPPPQRQSRKYEARRAAVHGLRLPGEAQPTSVRRCTCRHRHTPHTGRPNWCSRNLVQTRKGRKPAAKRVTAPSSTTTSASDSASDSS